MIIYPFSTAFPPPRAPLAGSDDTQPGPKSLAPRWGWVPHARASAVNMWVLPISHIGSMYGIYDGILMVIVTIYSSTMDPMGFDKRWTVEIEKSKKTGEICLTIDSILGRLTVAVLQIYSSDSNPNYSLSSFQS